MNLKGAAQVRSAVQSETIRMTHPRVALSSLPVGWKWAALYPSVVLGFGAIWPCGSTALPPCGRDAISGVKNPRCKPSWKWKTHRFIEETTAVPQMSTGFKPCSRVSSANAATFPSSLSYVPFVASDSDRAAVTRARCPLTVTVIPFGKTATPGSQVNHLVQWLIWFCTLSKVVRDSGYKKQWFDFEGYLFRCLTHPKCPPASRFAFQPGPSPVQWLHGDGGRLPPGACGG